MKNNKDLFRYGMILICFFIFKSVSAKNNESVLKLENKSYVPQEMYGFQENIISLSKYFNDLDAYASKKNREDIRPSLKHLISLSEGLSQHKRLALQKFKVPIGEFKPHLRSVLDMYDAEKYKMSLWRLKASLNACDQCHSQANSKKISLWNVDEKLSGLTLYQKAELYFVLRNYEKSKTLFKEIIYNSSPDETIWKLSVDRMLVVMVKIEGSPSNFLFEINQILKNKNLSQFQKNKYTVWRSELKEIIQNKNPNILNIETFLRNVYPVEKKGYSKDVRMQYVANFINRYLDENQKNETGEILYWLGVIDLELNHQLFFSFGESYLKSCIVKYSKTDIAKKCYGSLEEYIKLGFTGSQGEFIPYDVQQDLKQLKRKI